MYVQIYQMTCVRHLYPGITIFLEIFLKYRYTGVPGISPPVISPPPGQIPRDLALPARPPLGISPPPRPNDTVQRIFLYLDVATKKASEIWFVNFLTMVCASQTRSQCCLIFSKVGVDFLFIVYVYIVCSCVHDFVVSF